MKSSEFLEFPPEFTWGAATAAYQIEGAVSAEGRGPSIWDTFTNIPGKVENNHTGKKACGHYHLWKDDINLMTTLGLKAYRFSISWTRILPEGVGVINQKGVDFYDRLVDRLLEKQITPYITLYHWDLPQVLEDRGGWRVKSTSWNFAEYAGVMVDKLSDRVKNWITLNEPWCSSILGYERGIHAPGAREIPRVVNQVIHNLLYGHGLALQAMRQSAKSKIAIGFSHNPLMSLPADDTPQTLSLATEVSYEQNRWFLDPVFMGSYPGEQWDEKKDDVPETNDEEMKIISGSMDFLGLNLYNGVLVNKNPETLRDEIIEVPYPAKHPHTSMGWPVNPDCISVALDFIDKYYDVPGIFITENGCAYPDGPEKPGIVEDDRRVDYLRSHFARAHRAIAEGRALAGYFVWSFLDNFEWERGYNQRFGITHVDYQTLKRTFKDSAWWYRDVIKNNGFKNISDRITAKHKKTPAGIK